MGGRGGGTAKRARARNECPFYVSVCRVPARADLVKHARGGRGAAALISVWLAA